MAYDFNGTDQYIVTSSAPVTAFSYTIACWARKDLDPGGILVSLGDSTNANTCAFLATGSPGGEMAQAIATNAAAQSNTAVSGSPITGVWFHAAGTFSSSTNVLAFANGVSGGTGITNVTPTGLNRLSIGARVRSYVNEYFNGQIAEVGIWNVGLDVAEIQSLAKGVACDKVRPQSLRFYAPLIRDLQDERGGLTLTNTNTATVANHPRVYK